MTRRLAIAIVCLLALAGCQTVTSTPTVTRPVSAGPPRGEAAHDPLQTKTSYRPKHGNAEQATYYSGGGCGKERWAQKTLTDPNAANVNLVPQDSSISDLVSIAPPAQPTDRVSPTEETTFRVQGVITFAKQESDGDYHVVVKDPQGDTMIVESTAPDCAQGSRVIGQIQAVRQALDQKFGQLAGGQVLRGLSQPVTVEGVGFFDRLHGQTGVAPNGIELHPLTAIAFG